MCVTCGDCRDCPLADVFPSPRRRQGLRWLTLASEVVNGVLIPVGSPTLSACTLDAAVSVDENLRLGCPSV